MGARRGFTWLTGSRALHWGLSALLLLAGCYAYIAHAMASGVTTLDRSSLDGNPDVYDLPYRDVAFSPRGDEWADIVLRGWIIEKEGFAGPQDELTVILVHGLNSNRTGDNALALTNRLFDLDFNVLLFDLRGHGESDGDQLSGGYFEKWDVLGAYDYLVQRGVPPERVSKNDVNLQSGGATCGQSWQCGSKFRRWPADPHSPCSCADSGPARQRCAPQSSVWAGVENRDCREVGAQ